MSRKKIIGIAIGVLIVLLLVAGSLFKFPKNGDIFEFPSTHKAANNIRPEKVLLSTKEEAKQLPSVKNRQQPEVYTQEDVIVYENLEGLSEEELYNLSTKNKSSKVSLNKSNDRTLAGEEAKGTESQPSAEQPIFLPGQQQIPGTREPAVSAPSSDEETSGEGGGSSPPIGSIPIIIQTPEAPLAPETGHGLTPTTNPTGDPVGQEVASIPLGPVATDPGTTEEPIVLDNGKTVGELGFFQVGDVVTLIGLGGVSTEPSSPEVIPEIGERAPGGLPMLAEELVPAEFPADEVGVQGMSCGPISNADGTQFDTLPIRSSEFYTENPALNRFDFSIPFSSFSKLWSQGEPLIIGVAVFREDQAGSLARVTTARWNDLPAEIHQASTFNFSVTSPRVFGKPTRARIMVWVGEEAICVDETALRKFAIALHPEAGKIFVIPNEEERSQKVSIQPTDNKN